MGLKDLFRPRWKHSDLSKRLDAVKRLEDRKKLSDIAKNDNNFEVRIAAVEKSSDQKMLSDIAKNDNNFEVRITAIKKISDQKLLSEIAKNDKECKVRETAVEKLEDQSMLAGIARMDEDRNVRNTAMEKLTDQKVLADILKKEKVGFIRKKILEKLNTSEWHDLFIDIIENDFDPEVRKVAFHKLDSKEQPQFGKFVFKEEIESLLKILKNDKGYRVMGGDDPIESAIEELSEKGKFVVSLIIDSIHDYKGYPLCSIIEVLGKIGDKRAVEPLINSLKDENARVREGAVEALGKIKDKRAIEPLIHSLKDENANVREVAVEALGKMYDKRAVEPLIHSLKDENTYVRERAVEALGKIKDKRAVEPLMTIALEDEIKDIREKARLVINKIDWREFARLKLLIEEQAIEVDPQKKHIYDLMHSNKEYNEENPITLRNRNAIIYYHRGSNYEYGMGWILEIPTQSRIRDERQIRINPDENPDKFVFDALNELPNWIVGTTPDRKLFELMKSDWVFDYNNPIFIENLAYVFYDQKTNEWFLRIPIGEAEKNVNLSKSGLITQDIHKTILDYIAAFGLGVG
ncbi:MAG: hypothetical protein GTO45_39950 [Candidatus Aminicenantes bacterium]|nr:hypothetical protein [Candidatus Aminicenantes bacterium]NIM84793.1 hypothetical protein [Candidatus Aminicenantes bacterium]NIN24295.1 hypothetical protein [Candidatus Aminicenantes bacterium]NIN48054.1 hypothetical protein [Candidatus Aminicenantes bacterium]NIN90956.1 hypothetical protein [Candidatus Aminicenantes bacterium]